MSDRGEDDAEYNSGRVGQRYSTTNVDQIVDQRTRLDLLSRGYPDMALGDIAMIARQPPAQTGDPVINQPSVGTYDQPLRTIPRRGGAPEAEDLRIAPRYFTNVDPTYKQYRASYQGVPIRSYAQGGYIDEDQVAQLHAGEYVVPADQVALSGASARPVKFPEPPADAGGGGGGGGGDPLRSQYDAGLARSPQTESTPGAENTSGRPPRPESLEQYKARMSDTPALDPSAPAPAATAGLTGVEADGPAAPAAGSSTAPAAPAAALDDTRPPNMRTRAEIKRDVPPGQGTAPLPPEVAENKPMAVGAPGPQALSTGDNKPAPLTPQIKPSMRRYLELEQRDPELFRDVNDAAVKAGIDPVSYANVLFLESRWNRKTPDSSMGAMGLAQVMPDTVKEIDPSGRLDPRNDKDNLVLGAMYLRRMNDRYGPGSASSYAAYFAGPGKVDSIYRLSPEDQRKYYPHVLNYPAQVSSDNLAGVARPGAGSVEDRTGGSLSYPNVNATFQARVGAWMASLTPEQRSKLHIGPLGATRTVEQQREIYDRHQAQGGGPAARPGTSAHNYQIAFDISGIDPAGAKTLPNFGLAQNVPNDPVHIEPIEVPSGFTHSADDRVAAFKRIANGELKLGDIPGVDVTNAPPVQIAADVGGAVPASGSGGPRPNDGRPIKGDEYNLTGPANIDPMAVVRATAQGGPDAGHQVLMSMVPRGMANDSALRGFQSALVHLAIQRGQDPTGALEFATIYGQQGAFQHSVKAANAFGMGDFNTAANEMNTAYNNFFPDGHYSRFVGTTGGVYGERFDPQTGQRIGDRFGPLTMADFQRVANITATPATYQKTLYELQTLAEQSRHSKVEEAHQAQVADETARRNRDLAQHESNLAREALAKQQLDEQRHNADRKEKEAEFATKMAEINQKREQARTEQEMNRELNKVQPLINTLVTSDATIPAEQKPGIASIMNNLLGRDAKTPGDMAIYIAKGIADGTLELDPRTSRYDPNTKDTSIPVRRKGEQTVLTYLPRSVLTQGGYWTFDPTKPEAVGAPKPPREPYKLKVPSAPDFTPPLSNVPPLPGNAIAPFVVN